MGSLNAFFAANFAILLLAGHAVLADPTDGFTQLSLTNSNFQIQRPYDVPLDQRYSFVNGVHRMWVYSDDKPHTPTSNTKPRTEIRIRGYDYSSGIWQLEGQMYVPQGTTGACVMQILGALNVATTIQLRVYDGSLKYYQQNIVASNIYNRWLRINVIHDTGARGLTVFVDGVKQLEVADRGGSSHYFKVGVYGQDGSSHYMESRWRNIKLFRK